MAFKSAQSGQYTPSQPIPIPGSIKKTGTNPFVARPANPTNMADSTDSAESVVLTGLKNTESTLIPLRTVTALNPFEPTPAQIAAKQTTANRSNQHQPYQSTGAATLHRAIGMNQKTIDIGGDLAANVDDQGKALDRILEKTDETHILIGKSGNKMGTMERRDKRQLYEKIGIIFFMLSIIVMLGVLLSKK